MFGKMEAALGWKNRKLKNQMVEGLFGRFFVKKKNEMAGRMERLQEKMRSAEKVCVGEKKKFQRGGRRLVCREEH